jgi:hypothetical protein
MASLPGKRLPRDRIASAKRAPQPNATPISPTTLWRRARTTCRIPVPSRSERRPNISRPLPVASSSTTKIKTWPFGRQELHDRQGFRAERMRLGRKLMRLKNSPAPDFTLEPGTIIRRSTNRPGKAVRPAAS